MLSGRQGCGSRTGAILRCSQSRVVAQRADQNGAKTESVTTCSQAGCIEQQAVREKLQHQQLLTWMNVKTTATSFVTFLMHP